MSASRYLIETLIEQERSTDQLLRKILTRLEELETPRGAVSPAEFAKAVGVSEATVRRAIESGYLRTIRLGPKTLRIPTTELLGHLELIELKENHDALLAELSDRHLGGTNVTPLTG